MKLRDDACGLHAQGEAHELPHGKRLLGMRRLTPVGIPFLQASPFLTDRVFGLADRVAATCKPHPADGQAWGASPRLLYDEVLRTKMHKMTPPDGGRRRRALDQERLGECEWREGHAVPGHAVVWTAFIAHHFSRSMPLRLHTPLSD